MCKLPNYNRATNAAYRILVNQQSLELPIDIKRVIRKNQNLRLLKYSETAKRFGLTLHEYLQAVPSEFGFVKKKGDKAIILYNDTKSLETNRFTISHELGHYILGHEDDDETARKEADCFARNIPCPIPVIKELNMIDDTSAYMNTFYISEPMATTSIALAESDFYYIENYYY